MGRGRRERREGPVQFDQITSTLDMNERFTAILITLYSGSVRDIIITLEIMAAGTWYFVTCYSFL